MKDNSEGKWKERQEEAEKYYVDTIQKKKDTDKEIQDLIDKNESELTRLEEDNYRAKIRKSQIETIDGPACFYDVIANDRHAVYENENARQFIRDFENSRIYKTALYIYAKIYIVKAYYDRYFGKIYARTDVVTKRNKW